MPRQKHNLILCLLLLCVLGLIYRSLVSNRVDQSEFQSPLRESNDFKSKHLVVASLNGNDTSWIQRRLPEWSSSVYIADNANTRMTVPVNKGREAMIRAARYLIDNYKQLPEVMVFIHGLQYQWHNDDPNYDSATIISRLQIPYVLKEGYANLRCVWRLGCPDEIHTDRPLSNQLSEVFFREGFQQLFPEKQLPDLIAASCCAQFALSRKQAQKIPLEKYVNMREWLMQTHLEDDVSGRIMEYSWHILFGRDAVYCPSAKSCYCDVFGLCNLKDCTDGDCGRYYMPPQSNQPPWWKEDPVLANGGTRD